MTFKLVLYETLDSDLLLQSAVIGNPFDEKSCARCTAGPKSTPVTLSNVSVSLGEQKVR